MLPSPLRFEASLVLSMEVNEDGVVQILGKVVHGVERSEGPRARARSSALEEVG